MRMQNTSGMCPHYQVGEDSNSIYGRQNDQDHVMWRAHEIGSLLHEGGGGGCISKGSFRGQCSAMFLAVLFDV